MAGVSSTSELRILQELRGYTAHIVTLVTPLECYWIAMLAGSPSFSMASNMENISLMTWAAHSRTFLLSALMLMGVEAEGLAKVPPAASKVEEEVDTPLKDMFGLERSGQSSDYEVPETESLSLLNG
jgi:hypothetical protein